MSWSELPVWAQEAISERFPGLAGPSGAGISWKAQGDPTESFTGFEAGRLIAVISRQC